MKSININNEEYDIIDPIFVEASNLITEAWVKLGKPQDPFSEAGKKVVDLLIAVWEDLCPKDSVIWKAARTQYQDAELSISEQVHKHTGRSLAAYPPMIYFLMLRLFKGFDPSERKNCMKMVKIWPIFRFANKV